MTFSGGGVSSDEIVSQYCDNLLNSDDGIPEKIKLDDIREDLIVTDERKLYKPLTTVLFQEIDRFNNLLQIINSTLEKLICAIKGTELMSAVLDDVYHSLFNNQVPRVWAANAYPSLKPLQSWVKDLKRRVDFFQKWILQGKPDQERYRMPFFFFPQGFLTGVLQSYARENAIPIDTLNFDFRVVDPDKDASKEDPLEPGAVLIYGLYLEGTRWDKKRRSLLDQYEDKMYDKMLPIAFIPKAIRTGMTRDMKKSAKPQQIYS